MATRLEQEALRVEAIRSVDDEEDAISAAASRLAREVGRVWLARPWGVGRVDRAMIDCFHKAAVDGDSELVARMLHDVGRFGVPTLLESRNSAGWTPLMWAAWHAKVRACYPDPQRPAVLALSAGNPLLLLCCLPLGTETCWVE